MKKLVIYVLALFLLVSIVYAVVSHSPTQITPGTFQSGDYTFDGDLNLTSGHDFCIEGSNCLSSAAGAVGGTGAANRAAFWTAASTLSSNTNFTWDNTNQRLGLGTASPTWRLHVAGSGVGTDLARILVSSSDDQAGIEFDSDDTGSAIIYSPDGTDNLVLYVAGQTDAVTVQNSTGFVGIGTTNPSARLDVEVSSGGAATIGGPGNIATGDYSTAIGYYSNATWNHATAIGNNAHSAGYTSTAIGRYVRALGDSSIALGDLTTASGIYSLAMGRGITADGESTIAIALNNQPSTNVTQDNTMAIMGGNVGIGTIAPSQRLQVTGNINVSGDIYYGGDLNAYGADFAEKMTMAEELVAGDVVCLNEDLMIEKCNMHGQKAVAGVVSENPSLVGNSGAENAVPVGIVGIVPTKVRGPVDRFDLLTTSSLSGFAEKATIEDFGAILGKAMEPCQRSVCEIKVLIGLR